jgi:hypothetical protein
MTENAFKRTTLVKQLFIKRDNAREKTTETAFQRTTLIKQLFIKRDNARGKQQKPLSSEPPLSNSSS